MNSAHLPLVNLRTAKTYEDLASGFTFRVQGDGRVETPLADRFGSAQNLESVEDRRLREFAQRENAIAFANPAPTEAEAKEQLAAAAHATLGTEWQVDALYGGRSAVDRVVLKHSQGGVSQTVDIENREHPSKLTLSTSAMLSGWQVNHSIDVRLQGTLDPSSVVESAYLQTQ